MHTRLSCSRALCVVHLCAPTNTISRHRHGGSRGVHEVSHTLQRLPAGYRVPSITKRWKAICNLHCVPHPSADVVHPMVQCVIQSAATPLCLPMAICLAPRPTPWPPSCLLCRNTTAVVAAFGLYNGHMGCNPSMRIASLRYKHACTQLCAGKVQSLSAGLTAVAYRQKAQPDV